MYYKILLGALVSISLSGCFWDDHELESVLPNYDASLNFHDATVNPTLIQAEVLLKYESNIDAIRFITEEEAIDMDEKLIGVCIHKDNVILFNESIWNKMSDDQKLALMIHELAHCDLNKRHSTDEYECNNTIMHPRFNCTYLAFNNLTNEQIIKELTE